MHFEFFLIFSIYFFLSSATSLYSPRSGFGSLKAKVEALNQETQQSLKALDSHESTISRSISIAYEKLKKATGMSIGDGGIGEAKVDDSEGLLMKLKSFCHKMEAKQFWIFVTSRKKEIELFQSELPKALSDCVDPPRFVLEAISEVFPVVSSLTFSYDLGWACVEARRRLGMVLDLYDYGVDLIFFVHCGVDLYNFSLFYS